MRERGVMYWTFICNFVCCLYSSLFDWDDFFWAGVIYPALRDHFFQILYSKGALPLCQGFSFLGSWNVLFVVDLFS